MMAAITENVMPSAYCTCRLDSLGGGNPFLPPASGFVCKRAVFTGFPQAARPDNSHYSPAMLRSAPENYIKKQNDPGAVADGDIIPAPPRADDSLPQSKNIPYHPYLSGPARIMAAMPQFSRPRIKQRRKKYHVGSERWLRHTEFLEIAPPAGLKEIGSPFEGTFFARTLLGTGRARYPRAGL